MERASQCEPLGLPNCRGISAVAKGVGACCPDGALDPRHATCESLHARTTPSTPTIVAQRKSRERGKRGHVNFQQEAFETLF